MKNYTQNVLNKIEGEKVNEDKIITPCNTGVLLKFYDKNPYMTAEKSEGGIFIASLGNEKHKSNETGEIENNQELIACAKVIAVGPKCENVKVGEDVFLVKHYANPIPYKRLGYYIMSEQNIFCRVSDIIKPKRKWWKLWMN